jgi:hypothetical protein
MPSFASFICFLMISIMPFWVYSILFIDWALISAENLLLTNKFWLGTWGFVLPSNFCFSWLNSCFSYLSSNTTTSTYESIDACSFWSNLWSSFDSSYGFCLTLKSTNLFGIQSPATSAINYSAQSSTCLSVWRSFKAVSILGAKLLSPDLIYNIFNY